MSPIPTALIQALELQAAICAQMGSPFSAMVARAVAADMTAGGVFADLAEPWAGHDVRGLLGDATPLRFMGGLHYLALTGEAAELAAVYPPMGSNPDEALLPALVSWAGRDHRQALARFLRSPPQTNEVNRSVCLIGGFLTVAARTGLPLRCLEIGASAGLNLNWDRYRYELGASGAWGDADSPVRLSAEWNGEPAPFGVAARVIERRGCDQSPIDLTIPDQALRLKAYFWPDQAERLARLDGAIALAKRHPPQVERADAADWTRSHARPAVGCATVVYHSVVWQYLTPQTQADVAATIESAGESAAADSPLAWLRMEPNPADLAAPLELKLTFWPGGEETLLARVHPHGAKVSWAGV